jgi:hypothetical protein
MKRGAFAPALYPLATTKNSQTRRIPWIPAHVATPQQSKFISVFPHEAGARQARFISRKRCCKNSWLEIGSGASDSLPGSMQLSSVLIS